MAHEHGSSRKALGIAGGIELGYLGVEVVGALVSGSLALLADAAHTALDILALGLAWGGGVAGYEAGHRSTQLRVHARRGDRCAGQWRGAADRGGVDHHGGGRSGWERPRRCEAASSRSWRPADSRPTLSRARCCCDHRAPTSTCARLFLHIMGDGLGSIAAIVAGVLVLAFDWRFADPALSVFIALILIYVAVRVVRDAVHVLLEGTPEHVGR